ncbi:hypothetical protein IAI10_13665 [Clostridium sp. 19966]|uniref:hypothetical protein n=1 Tax=Clostridium sp. 19966 TaxID=2768166 RepID=UPI0028DE8C68|nr:hypothetical protein [Clostridium sp. 19966]MDT8717711.1 hypothetical protein [Clostridium sp. 19966]
MTLLKIMGISSIVLLISTIICGLWIKFHPEGSDLNFHFKLSIISVVLSLITIILFMKKK